jgi:hypothetical protein
MFTRNSPGEPQPLAPTKTNGNVVRNAPMQGQRPSLP